MRMPSRTPDNVQSCEAAVKPESMTNWISWVVLSPIVRVAMRTAEPYQLLFCVRNKPLFGVPDYISDQRTAVDTINE